MSLYVQIMCRNFVYFVFPLLVNMKIRAGVSPMLVEIIFVFVVLWRWADRELVIFLAFLFFFWANYIFVITLRFLINGVNIIIIVKKKKKTTMFGSEITIWSLLFYFSKFSYNLKLTKLKINFLNIKIT